MEIGELQAVTAALVTALSECGPGLRAQAEAHLGSLCNGPAGWQVLLAVVHDAAVCGHPEASPLAAPIRLLAAFTLRRKITAAVSSPAIETLGGAEAVQAVRAAVCRELAVVAPGPLQTQLALCYAALSSAPGAPAADTLEMLTSSLQGAALLDCMRLVAEYGVPEVDEEDVVASAAVDAAAGFVTAAGRYRSAWLQHAAGGVMDVLETLSAAPLDVDFTAALMACFRAWAPWTLPQARLANSAVLNACVDVLTTDRSVDTAVVEAAAAAVSRLALLAMSSPPRAELPAAVLATAQMLAPQVVLSTLTEPGDSTGPQCSALAAAALSQLPSILQRVCEQPSEEQSRCSEIISAMATALRLPPAECAVETFPFWRRLEELASATPAVAGPLAAALCGAADGMIRLASSPALLAEGADEGASFHLRSSLDVAVCGDDLGSAIRSLARVIGPHFAASGALGSLQCRLAEGRADTNALIGHLVFLCVVTDLGDAWPTEQMWLAAISAALGLNATLPGHWRVRGMYARWLAALCKQAKWPSCAEAAMQAVAVLTSQADAAMAHLFARAQAALSLAVFPPDTLRPSVETLCRLYFDTKLPTISRRAVAVAAGRALSTGDADTASVAAKLLEESRTVLDSAELRGDFGAATSELAAWLELWQSACKASAPWLSDAFDAFLRTHASMPRAVGPLSSALCDVIDQACRRVPLSQFALEYVPGFLLTAPTTAAAVRASAALADATQLGAPIKHHCTVALHGAAEGPQSDFELWNEVFTAGCSAACEQNLGADVLAPLCDAAMALLRDSGQLPCGGDAPACTRSAANLLAVAASSPWLATGCNIRRVADVVVAAATSPAPLPRGAGIAGIAAALLSATPGGEGLEAVCSALDSAAASGAAPKLCTDSCIETLRDASVAGSLHVYGSIAVRRALVTLHRASARSRRER
eukprot:TRINITY_DN21996_c0_g1_i1.p1 TRINITY_DN21996_c0_g1~~TRINITY_DN21996_c0_g1_i1.p1  ORF type:complete len:936 (+),score=264.89 TRINITY_DN21996_c0_g1_i1:64-2871(+)